MKCRPLSLWMLGAVIAGTAVLKAQTHTAGRPASPVTSRPVCQIMDRPAESLFETDIAYLYQSDVGHAGRAGFLEMGAGAKLGYFRLPFGDIDAGSELRTVWINESGYLEMPNQLFMARLPLTWIGRYHDGLSASFALKPGYYGDGESLSSKNLFMPVGLSVVRAFAAELSGVAGLEFRPGFDRQWFPIFGAVWQPGPAVRLEALLPRGMLSLAVSRDWRLYAGYAWESIDYSLDDPRRQLTVEDLRLMIGANLVMHTELELTFEIGTVTGRRLKFHRPSDRFDPDPTMFVRLGLSAPF